MADHDLDPARFGTAFKAFMEAVVAAAAPPSSPLLERISPSSRRSTTPSTIPTCRWRWMPTWPARDAGRTC